MKWEVPISTAVGSSETLGVSVIFLGLGGDRSYHLLDCYRGSSATQLELDSRSYDILELLSGSETGFLRFIQARTSEKCMLVSAGN